MGKVTTRAGGAHPPLLQDVLNGAVRGDFARRLGAAGLVTQAALGYVPVIGTMTAWRDLVASTLKHDYLDAGLNGLALLPVFGGVPKTIEALHNALKIGGALHADR